MNWVYKLLGIPHTYYNGFWRFGTTGWTGGSSKKGYVVEESKTIIPNNKIPNWIIKLLPEEYNWSSWGWQRHVPRDDPMSDEFWYEYRNTGLDCYLHVFDDKGDTITNKFVMGGTLHYLEMMKRVRETDGQYCYLRFQTREENPVYIGTAREFIQLVLKRGIVKFEDVDGASIGYSYKDGKWYGWSHRAIYGFCPGSKVEKGDCAYEPANKEDFLEDSRRWHGDDVEIFEDYDEGYKGLVVRRTDPAVKEAMRLETFEPYPEKWGRGEWTARNDMDAREMAIAFSRSVS